MTKLKTLKDLDWYGHDFVLTSEEKKAILDDNVKYGTISGKVSVKELQELVINRIKQYQQWMEKHPYIYRHYEWRILELMDFFNLTKEDIGDDEHGPPRTPNPTPDCQRRGHVPRADVRA